MVDTERIRTFVEQRLAGGELFLVDVRLLSGGETEVTIDGDRGASLDACIELSRAIEAAFEGETDDMWLTVASAGIGQPLKLLRQYRKLAGRTVEVVLRSGVKIVATLVEADESSVVLRYTRSETVETPAGKRKKTKVEVEQRYSLDEIKSTREQLDFS
ncbi:MAG: ribosome assembly cofactor RimP [Rikenellaceae bacterium]|jgi:ribosome maturation factor RimP|nr:ribosome assembly cofactor RimP [Rikenellaceae bacterium]